MNCDDYRDLVAADIDGELTADERSAAAQHVLACTACDALRQAQLGVRERLRRHHVPTMPAALRQQVLQNVQQGTTAKPAPSPARVLPLFTRRRLLMVGAVAASFLVTMLPLGRWSQPDLLGLLVHDAQAAESERLDYSVRSTDVVAVREYYRRESLGFDNTAPDLQHRGLHPIGGRIDRDGPSPAAVTVYDGPAGTTVCRRYAYGTVEIPTGGEAFGEATVVTRDGVTMRFVRDGDALCCLASTMPREQFLQQFGLKRSDA